MYIHTCINHTGELVQSTENKMLVLKEGSFATMGDLSLDLPSAVEKKKVCHELH
jgi:hypothetical protein